MLVGLLDCPAQLNFYDSCVHSGFGMEQRITWSNNNQILFQLFDFCITFDSEVGAV